MPDASTQTPAPRKKLVKVAPPPAAVEVQTTEGIQSTRRPLSDSSKKKYDQAIQRLKTAGYDIEKQTKEVIEWIKKQGGTSAQLLYYSAIKYELGKMDKPFPMPKVYQDEIDRLAGEKNAKSKSQVLSENQQTNYLPLADLVAVHQRLRDKQDKTDADWKDYLVASLYTMQPPVRADYGEMKVFGKRSSRRTGNELIWGQKKDAYFVFREYKTAKTYGKVEVKVSPAMLGVITDWFAHLGKTPKFLLGRAITPNDLLGVINHAFRSTKKDIGVNLLRHAYITEFMKTPRTIAEREELAKKMLHDKDTQEKYAVASELKD
jgi:hypothetical protein